MSASLSVSLLFQLARLFMIYMCLFIVLICLFILGGLRASMLREYPACQKSAPKACSNSMLKPLGTSFVVSRVIRMAVQ